MMPLFLKVLFPRTAMDPALAAVRRDFTSSNVESRVPSLNWAKHTPTPNSTLAALRFLICYLGCRCPLTSDLRISFALLLHFHLVISPVCLLPSPLCLS